MLSGCNLIGYETGKKGTEIIKAFSTLKNTYLEPAFFEATNEEIECACLKAQTAFRHYRKTSVAQRAAFLQAIAKEITAAKDLLIERANAETALPPERLAGELTRTCFQLHFFADLIVQGNVFSTSYSAGDADRKPLPRPSLLKRNIPIGPVLVSGASNFPFAFSTAGGDTAAALAAGCPVIIKAHPGHLGTNELVAHCILKAAKDNEMPDGVFSSLNGNETTGKQLILHPAIKAVAFTGSQKGGMSIFKSAATERTEPIPVFAEMGSINPIVILPQIQEEDYANTAQKIAASITLGVGQFCTKPGLLVLCEHANTNLFLQKLAKHLIQAQPACMLNQQVYNNFIRAAKKLSSTENISLLTTADDETVLKEFSPAAILMQTNAADFLLNAAMQEEVFGPCALVVRCKNKEETEHVIAALKGQLTATIFATAHELQQHISLLHLLSEKAGRVLYNNVPTGVEVHELMVHGGPYPATTDPHYTSVGGDAILRFVRPLCYQNIPPEIMKALYE